MKKLTNLLTALFIITVINTEAYCGENEYIKNEKDRIEVTFNRKMDFNDLVRVKLELADKGITISYRMLQFDETGGLKAIDFSVDFHDGLSGSAKSIKIYNNSRFGFFRDYKKDAEIPVLFGNLEQ